MPHVLRVSGPGPGRAVVRLTKIALTTSTTSVFGGRRGHDAVHVGVRDAVGSVAGCRRRASRCRRGRGAPQPALLDAEPGRRAVDLVQCAVRMRGRLTPAQRSGSSGDSRPRCAGVLGAEHGRTRTARRCPTSMLSGSSRSIAIDQTCCRRTASRPAPGDAGVLAAARPTSAPAWTTWARGDGPPGTARRRRTRRPGPAGSVPRSRRRRCCAARPARRSPRESFRPCQFLSSPVVAATGRCRG
jgi:hypothetical protein